MEESNTNTDSNQPEGNNGGKVPFIGAVIQDHSMNLGKVPARRFYSEAELLFNTMFAVNRWYGFDGQFIFPDTYNLEVEALGGKLSYSDIALPSVDLRDPLIKKPEDLNKLGSLDITKGRIPFNLELVKLMLDKMGPEVPTHICGPFSFLCQAMGYPNMIKVMKQNKSFAKDLFEFAENEVVYPHVAALTKLGAKVIVGIDAWCVFPNITPALGNEWIVPSALRLMGRTQKELGVGFMTANCVCEYCEEDPAKFDKKIMFQCFDVMQKIQQGFSIFNLQGRTQDFDMSWVQEYAISRGVDGNKIPIWMSLNARFMRNSSPEQIFNKLREWIDIMGRDQGLMIAIGAVPSDTPPENIHTAVSAVNALGQFPIQEDLHSIPFEVPTFQPFEEWLKDQPEAEIILSARK